MSAATDQRPVVLLVAAVVAIVVVGLVLAVGVARPPRLATIAADPAVTPPGAVALYGWTDGESCLTVVTPDGASDRPWCSQEGGDLIGWTDRGILLRTYDTPDEVELVIDPDDGEVVTSRAAAGEYRSGRQASAVVTSRPRGGGDLEVRLHDGTVLWRTEAPDTYRIGAGWLSPDGRSVALLDNAERLLIVPADGSQEPRIWAEDVSAWYQLAWQGGRD